FLPSLKVSRAYFTFKVFLSTLIKLWHIEDPTAIYSSLLEIIYLVLFNNTLSFLAFIFPIQLNFHLLQTKSILMTLFLTGLGCPHRCRFNLLGLPSFLTGLYCCRNLQCLHLASLMIVKIAIAKDFQTQYPLYKP